MSMMQLEGKVAIVTGGAKGIGKALVALLARAGADVAIFDADVEEARKTAGQTASPRRLVVSKVEPRVKAYAVEVTSRASVNAAVRQVIRDFGKIDILINNAGIWRGATLLKMSERAFSRVMAVNVKGPLLCVQAVAPHLIKQGSGKIVNIASVAGLRGSTPWGAYCASKAALINMTQTFAQELAPHNVHCNAFLPGATRTPLLDQIVREQPGSAFPHALPAEEVARQILELVIPYEQERTGEAVAVRKSEDRS